ncbi:MAG: nucleotide sugar dehydrogenase [Bacteroidia bacterium]|nr:nucleotide sugar dehydrogenase [Bacteroidia bacterium]MCX7764327.1 nucleotide sugar dehydrogenase [Bacteroidia bacterium]MDW8056941.1 nucleotide sugar dehydrogenase [Bacteroidia bacterium]
MRPAEPPVIGVVGLGYVGLPVAVSFSRHFPVIGYDISQRRIEELREGIDRNGEFPPETLKREGLLFTSDENELRRANFYIVAVPTPIDDYKVPDLDPLKSASETLARVLKPGDTVVYESTVYPGCTEEVCLPILEKSGLKAGKDFHLGYSPERINPGDPEHPIEKIIKIVSGYTPEGLQWIAQVYGQVIQAGLHKAPSIRVAEAAKVIENTQRDLNIALVNELAMLFQEMGLSVYDVLEAAGTKWNFHKYVPGLVGGHCIGVDPYYLTYKATAMNFYPQVILAGRRINDHFPRYLAERILQKLTQLHVYPPLRILVLGFTFKENVPDIRNTKVYDLIQTLRAHGAVVDVTDPYAHPEEVKAEYGIELVRPAEGVYDAIVIAVAHSEYRKLSLSDFKRWGKPQALIVDIKGIYRGMQWEGFHYWTL